MSSSDVVIRVEGLGKKYSLHHEQAERDTHLRDLLARQARAAGRLLNPFTLAGQLRKVQRQATQISDAREEEFWALKDVSFEIRRGERVGIIGRNGAGKSTLLKILSRITEPTTGRVEIRGRVASLLEVGTGFHPELTGRENIYLNGAILGMTRREIKAKFDEIVDFSEVEKFLDTPVKRYSSGMYVRLAFAVAAHLEPEILVVDEVLAVGDASFQKKCLGKMQDVSNSEGRTILFVSHNIEAIKKLCNTGILLKGGLASGKVEISSAISTYVQSYSGAGTTSIKWNCESAPGIRAHALLRSVFIRGIEGRTQDSFSSTEPILVYIDNEVANPSYCYRMRVSFELINQDGLVILASSDHEARKKYNNFENTKNQRVVSRCIIPGDLLVAGVYAFKISAGIPNECNFYDLDDLPLRFHVERGDAHGSSLIENWPGIVSPRLDWEFIKEDV